MMHHGGPRRILYVVPYVPLRGTPGLQGPKNVSGPLVRYLSENHHVTLVMITDHGESGEREVRAAYPSLEKVISLRKPVGWRRHAKRMLAVARGYPATVGEWMDAGFGRLLVEEARGHDLVHLDFFYLAPYTALLGTHAPVILTCHDAYSMGLARAEATVDSHIQRLGLWARKRAFLRTETKLYRHADAVVTVSKVDTAYLRSLRLVSVWTLAPAMEPWNVKTPESHMDTPPQILCVVPRADVSWLVQDTVVFLDSVLPRIRKEVGMTVPLTVWGRSAERVLECCKPTMAVRVMAHADDYGDFLAQNWIYVYPRRVGSGLHTKLLEAMASGLPVVGYREIMDAFNGMSGVHYFSCEDREGMGDAVVRLLKDEDLRVRVGNQAIAYVRDRHSLAVLGNTIEAIYEAGINSREPV
ncbi:MAG: glycosyltransferase family 4 protein [Planctomycetota bacterium]